MTLFSLYSKLPVVLQNGVISLQGFLIRQRRFSANFNRELARFEKRDPSEVNLDQLHTFVQHAKNSPFWNRRFRHYGVDLTSTKLLAELCKLPILTKEEVRNNVNDIKLDVPGDKIIPIGTSGTSGSSLRFTQTVSMENKQWAVWWRYRKRHGIEPNTWMAWFGGKTIVAVDQKKPPYWRINYPMKQIMFSAHHLNINTVGYYHRRLKESKIQWIHGYPSQISFLASLIMEKGLPPIKGIKFISTGAENLLDHQISLIESAFGTRPFQHYGLAEGVANISQLPTGEWQIDQDFAYVELIPTNVEDDLYHIVGTNYCNLSFPLLRYQTNDLARVKRVGEEIEIISIDGRKDDFITLPNGVKLGRLGFIFKNADFVKEAQIYQKSRKEVVLRVVQGMTYNKRLHEEFLRKECRQRMGSEMEITFQYLDKIPRTASGKFRYVVSDVKT